MAKPIPLPFGQPRQAREPEEPSGFERSLGNILRPVSAALEPVVGAVPEFVRKFLLEKSQKAAVPLEAFSEVVGPQVLQRLNAPFSLIGRDPLGDFAPRDPKSERLFGQFLQGIVGFDRSGNQEIIRQLSGRFQQRPVEEQLGLGLIDPFIALGGVKVAKTAGALKPFKVPKASGTALSTIAPSPQLRSLFVDERLRRIGKMWLAELTPERIPLLEKGKSLVRAAQRNLLDSTILAKQIGTEAKEFYKKHGLTMPRSVDANMLFSLLPGRASGAKVFVQQHVDRMLNVLGDEPQESVNTFLFLRHLFDVRKMHPERKMPILKDDADLRAVAVAFATELGPERLLRVQRAANEISAMYAELLRISVARGGENPALAAMLTKKYPWYNPIQYLEKEALAAAEGRRAPLSVTRSGLRRLSELGSDELVTAPLQLLNRMASATWLRASRNEASRALIKSALLDPEWRAQIQRVERVTRPVAQVKGKTAFRPATGEIPGTISYMENGRRRVFSVPPELERLAKPLMQVDSRNLERVFHFANAPFRAAQVTFNPAFMVVQFLTDTLHAATLAGTLPHKTAQVLIRNMYNLGRSDPRMQRMIKAGGDVSGFWGKGTDKIIKEMQEQNQLVLSTERDWGELLAPKNFFKTLMDVGHRIEMSPRLAVFERAVTKGSTDEVAATIARRTTADFDVVGEAMRLGNAAFLYLNPAIQGTMSPIRALRNPLTRKAATYGFMGYLSSHLMLYAWNRTFPEYKNISLSDKYGKMLIMLPSNEFDKRGNKVPHYFGLVPMVRELGAISAPMLYALGKLDDTAPEDVTTFLRKWIDLVNPLSMITGQQGLPIPTQAAHAATEIFLNHDVFRNRPIVPKELQGKLKAEQFDEKTSEVARNVGDFLGLSPMVVDFLMKQGAFYDLVLAADVALRASRGEDPVVEAWVAQLEELQESMPPEQIPLLRNELLSTLDSDLRNRVLKAERRPKPSERVPFLSSMQHRFYRTQGGNNWRVGQQQAEKETGLSAEQSREAGMILGGVRNEIREVIESLNRQLKEGGINQAAWRTGRSDVNALYRGAIVAIRQFLPSAAQIQEDPTAWSKYQEVLYTMAGSTADRRTRGQILVAGLRGVPLGELAPNIPDFAAWFEKRDEYKEGLSKSDQELLEDELRSTLTDTERDYFRDLKTLKVYWELDTQITQNYKDQYREFRRIWRTLGSEDAQAYREKEGRELFNEIVRPGGLISQMKIMMREKYVAIDALLRLWQFTTVYRHQDNLMRELAGMTREQVAAETR